MEELIVKIAEDEENGRDSHALLSRFKFDVMGKARGEVDEEAGASSSQNPFAASDSSEDMAASDSDDVMENRRKLLAEIRSCFRILSIHSRLLGTESPRTRRITNLTNSRQSLHSLAMEKSNDAATSCGTSKEIMMRPDDVQSCLLYDQWITGSSPATIADADVDVGHGAPDTRECSDCTTVNLAASLAANEPCSENIHQLAALNPTLQLKPKADLSKSDVVKVVEWLYRDHPGAVWRAASREAMADDENRSSLIYGEVSFVAFAKLMENYCPKRRTSVVADSNPLNTTAAASSSSCDDTGGFNFYDLGCGGGRCAFMASLLNTNCAKACGIEIVPGMHQMNQILLRLYNKEVRPNLHPLKQKQQLVFLLGDFLQMDWSDADVIFTNATCFEDPLFDKFEDMAAKILKPGSIIISVARFFSKRELWDLIDEQERRMSWAPAMVYVYRKK
ncbi:hypothetical protein MPTK1_4g21560 [Marchantia polymorpha subsp. ruderalis]|uniref:Histone-lysine N-methyltransferase, H3 lysine-79 specific n=2 Tax=Marchantia polymorpha TaxID=3197 RepID=A0AAF6BCC1_MARPO|nr:hypothetical protein MARPO_0090s0065 [Marchantia polymorpha]BBN09655.1 hypothetical protein Mp_4g21560 [Marchantia polymorpha subsp. ruderalis]|eukprot:PTQ33331.1 hypothetical protein MARPO_0090s0065 [Marchantia polymorpha]